MGPPATLASKRRTSLNDENKVTLLGKIVSGSRTRSNSLKIRTAGRSVKDGSMAPLGRLF
jgi:hypothetical protein